MTPENKTLRQSRFKQNEVWRFPLKQIILVHPYLGNYTGANEPSGFGGSTLPPYNVLPNAFDKYQSSGTLADPRTHFIDLGEEAALHLTGFRYTAQGGFDHKPESADGIHPTRQRHAELAEMLHKAIGPLLDAKLDAAGLPMINASSSGALSACAAMRGRPIG